MKKITATIRSSKLEEVTTALTSIDVNFFTYSQVKDISDQKPKEEMYRGQVREVKGLSRVTLDVLVSDASVEKTLKAILETAKTGEVGDGKVLVYDVPEAYRIRTGGKMTEEDAY